MSEVVGLDIGGSDIKYGALDLRGRALTDVAQVVKLPSFVRQGPQVTIEQLDHAFHELNLPHVDAIGLATAGPADLTGVIGKSTNYGDAWTDFDIRRAVEEHFNIPTIYENDANAAAIAEFHELLKAYPDLHRSNGFLLTIGTGLGGGVVVNGEVLRGARGMGGEVGHFGLADPVSFIKENSKYENYEVPVCGCERQGCAETYTSLSYLDRELRYLLQTEAKDHPLTQLEDKPLFRAKKLLGYAANEDSLAIKIINAQAVNVGRVCWQISAVLDPQWILIGGGITEGSEKVKAEYLDTVKRSFGELAYQQQKDTIISYATLGDNAGWVGAGLSALSALRA